MCSSDLMRNTPKGLANWSTYSSRAYSPHYASALRASRGAPSNVVAQSRENVVTHPTRAVSLPQSTGTQSTAIPGLPQTKTGWENRKPMSVDEVRTSAGFEPLNKSTVAPPEYHYLPKAASSTVPTFAQPPVEKKGLLGELFGVGSAQADELPATAPSKGFSGRLINDLEPMSLGDKLSIYDPRPDINAAGQPIMDDEGKLIQIPSTIDITGAPRDTMGARPTTMHEMPYTPLSDQPGFAPLEEPKKVKSETAAPKKAEQPAKSEGPFYGDWRDYEPWKSDPIGGFIDELTGDVPSSKTIGKPASEEGGFDILKEDRKSTRLNSSH